MDQVELSRIPLSLRRTMAHRHDASAHVLELLAADPDPDVRVAVARHPSTPVSALRRLAGDTVERVASRASMMVVVHRMAG